MAKFILTLIFSFLLGCISAQQSPGFREVDSTSYALYEQASWQELSKFGKNALNMGMDYYYLRMRVGIAYFEKGKYIQALHHFRHALNFYSGDITAMEYIYYSLVNLNKMQDAGRILKESPPGLQQQIRDKTPPRYHDIFLETGPLFSDQADVIKGFRVTGSSDIYGESDVMKSGFYFSAGGHIQVSPALRLTMAYTYLDLLKTRTYKVSNGQGTKDDYRLDQNQVYLNGRISLGNGYSLLPAFNYIYVNYRTLYPDVATDGITFYYDTRIFNNYIGYLSLSKDFGVAETSLFGAYSNLNDQDQYQAGLSITAYLAGNLNFYLSSTLLAHQNKGTVHGIFDQKIGFRVAKPAWIELSGTFGNMVNYHEDGAYVVYNVPDLIRFKADARFIWVLSDRFQLTVYYFYIGREGSILYFEDNTDDPTGDPLPRFKNYDYKNQYIIGGIKWKI